MNATYESLKDQSETDLYQKIESLVKKDPGAWQSICAVLGLAGGVSVPILGAISDVITWFVSSIRVISYLHVLSIVLCALTLPLLILGALCLDLLEAKITRLPPPGQTLYREPTTATAIRLPRPLMVESTFERR